MLQIVKDYKKLKDNYFSLLRYTKDLEVKYKRLLRDYKKLQNRK